MELEEKINEYEYQIKILKLDFNELKDLNDEYEEDIDDLEDKIDYVEKKMEALKFRLKTLSGDDYSYQQSRIIRKNKELQTLIAEKESLVSEIDVNELKLDGIEEEIDKLNSDVKSLKRQSKIESFSNIMNHYSSQMTKEKK